VAPRSPIVHRALPDGCIDIIFDLSLERFSEGMIVGTITRPLLFQADGPIHMVTVRFRPGGAIPFDCFLAAKQVGPTGTVIGVDMTGEMIERVSWCAGPANLNAPFG
jgi:hypothetical protein